MAAKQSPDADPLRPWGDLRYELRGPTGKPLSYVTLHRWRAAGVITPTQIGGRNYLRIRETMARLESVRIEESRA